MNLRTSLYFGLFGLVFGLAETPAYAALVVRVSDSVGTQTFQVGNANCPGCTANSIVATDADAAFSISLQIATSNAPSGPAILTLDSILTSTFGSLSAPDNLRIEVSDTGFLLPVGSGILQQRGTTNSPALGFATGTVTSTGYYGSGPSGDVLFCQAAGTCSTTTGALNFSSFALSTKEVGANTTFEAPFSLDEVVNISFTSPGTGQYSANLVAIPAAVPEPAAAWYLLTVCALIIPILRSRIS